MIKMINIEEIIVEESHYWNRQTENPDLRESIATVGQIDPIIVTPYGEKFKLLAGFHRYYVLKDLGILQAKCRVMYDEPNEITILLGE